MFSTMTSSVTNWFVSGNEEDKQTKSDQQLNETPAIHSETETQAMQDGNPSDTTEIKSDASASVEGDTVSADEEEKDIDFDELSAKAVTAAKEWGSYLFNVGKAASTQVAKTAIHIKDTVEEKTMLGEFNREQQKFQAENRDKKKDAAVAPWVGYNEEEEMKKQITALSGDKRNFLRNPPSGVQFQFDYEASHPVAMAMLQEDPRLKELRFELVPKQLKEDIFWRNYFYRVSLIKQSAQLTSLAQQTGSTGEKSSGRSSEPKSKVSQKGASHREEPDDLPSASPPDHEFISDAFQSAAMDEDALKQEMEQLGMTDSQNDEQENEAGEVADWERELQAELQEYEVVDDGSALDDPALEEELLQQIEAEANGDNKTA